MSLITADLSSKSGRELMTFSQPFHRVNGLVIKVKLTFFYKQTKTFFLGPEWLIIMFVRKQDSQSLNFALMGREVTTTVSKISTNL